MTDVVVGRVYVVAGQGPLRAAELMTPRSPSGASVRFVGLDGNNYYANHAQVVREIDAAGIAAHVEQLKAKGIVPRDFRVTWGEEVPA